MGIKTVGTAAKVTTAKAGASSGPQAGRLNLGSDTLAFTRRDGANPKAQAKGTPGGKALAVGLGIFAGSAVALGLTLAAPGLLTLAAGAGVVLGAGIAIKGAMDFAGYLKAKMEQETTLPPQ